MKNVSIKLHVHAPRKHLRLWSWSDLTMTIGATSWRQLYPRFKKHKSYPPVIEKIFSSFPITWLMPYFHSSPLKTGDDFDFLLLKRCRKNCPEYALTNDNPNNINGLVVANNNSNIINNTRGLGEGWLILFGVLLNVRRVDIKNLDDENTWTGGAALLRE